MEIALKSINSVMKEHHINMEYINASNKNIINEGTDVA